MFRIERTLVGGFTVMNVCVMTEETNLPRSSDSLSVRGGGGSGTGVIIVNVGPAVEPTRLR